LEESPSAPAPKEPPVADGQFQVAEHFGLTEKDRRADATYRTAFLKYGEIRAAGRLESYRRSYDLTDEQCARLLAKLDAEERTQAEAEWARFEAIRRDVMAETVGDVKSAIDRAWKRHASGDPSVGRAEWLRRAKERLDAWDHDLSAVLDPTQVQMLQDVKSRNADWMTDPDRHGSVISDLGDSFTARGLALTRIQLTGLARIVRAHVTRNPAILGSLPFETHGYPVGLIDWSDAAMQKELAQALPADRYAVLAAMGVD
jgi:hypothetical protein